MSDLHLPRSTIILFRKDASGTTDVFIMKTGLNPFVACQDFLATERSVQAATLNDRLIPPSSTIALPYLEATHAGNTPCIRLFVFVKQRFNALLTLPLGHPRWISHLEKRGRKFHQPLWLNCRDLAHVFPRGQGNLMIHDPFRLPVVQGAVGVHVGNLLVHLRLVPFLGIFFGRVAEKATHHRLLHAFEVFAAGNDIKLVAIHDAKQLLAHVGCTTQVACLDKVLVAPRVAEFVILPRIEHIEKRHMVALGHVELGLLLIGQCLLLLRSIEDGLYRQHADDGEDFVAAAKVGGLNQHFCLVGLEWKLGHATS
eukprot:m.1017874 g.1017874  ORF g.1017874 m.1017874 type:complete len:312 (-) comp24085_c0_seq3:3089-4024(-)